jgi:hypothetical protein
MQNHPPESAASGRWLGLVVVVGVLLGGAASFLPQQSLWVDEATQVIGLRLGPAGATRWLAGGEPHDPGQIPDRMPPLSYWAGWAWARVFGFDEASLRWFSVMCVAVAAVLVYETARLAFGTASAWVAGLLFALCPAMIVLSVEIRPYALFVLWSAAAFYVLVRLRATPPDERSGMYVALALVLAAAVSTHFFGAVLAGSILAALILLACRGAGRFRPIAGVGAVCAVSTAVQVPFIVASLRLEKHAITHAVRVGPSLDGVKNMLVRLVSHVTLSVHRPVAVIAVTAALVLIVFSISLARSSRQCAAVALTLWVGLLVVTVAKLFLNTFDAASSNYNAWMRPGFCVLMSAGVASQSRAVRRAAALAFGLLLVAQVTGVYQLAVHGDHFAHGPQRAIVELIRARNRGELAVIHDDASHRFVFAYFPITCELGPGVEHYKPVNGSDSATRVVDYPGMREARPVNALPYRYLLVVRLEATNPTNLLAQVRGGDRVLADGPIARELRASGDWRLVSERSVPASISGKIDLFERCGPPRAELAQRDLRSATEPGRTQTATSVRPDEPAPAAGPLRGR